MIPNEKHAPWRIIGIDCATDMRKVGVALLDQSEDGWILKEAKACGRGIEPLDEAVRWCEGRERVLFALDAPLGWPEAMGRMLTIHQAGELIAFPANRFFRRETDIFVQQASKKTPLDVGADRIARTAHWALSFLESLRARTEQPIPLAWSHTLERGFHAIEVYPAATLLEHGAKLKGYKATSGHDERRTIMELLNERLHCGQLLDDCILSADALDAVVCTLAGVDFLEGKAAPPPNLETARKEGWIWLRRSQ